MVTLAICRYTHFSSLVIIYILHVSMSQKTTVRFYGTILSSIFITYVAIFLFQCPATWLFNKLYDDYDILSKNVVHIWFYAFPS